MEHYISIDVEQGDKAINMIKAPLTDALKEAYLKAPDDKHDCWLFSNGYSDTTTKYTRAEHNFEWLDTILLDVDNKQSDPLLLEKFKEEFSQYDFILWESASSTVECPKFRVIMFLDRKIEWVNEPQKFTKQAIKELFAKYTDDNASWYFTMNKGKRNTIQRNRGLPFPSKRIEELVEIKRQIQKALTPSVADEWLKSLNKKRVTDNPDGWMKLPSVKKCLEGLAQGERDTCLNAACFAMDKCGYRGKIGEFLDMVSAPDEMTKKFRNKYRG